MRFLYPIEITERRGRRGQNSGFTVAFPDLPEASVWGSTREEALAGAVECLDMALAARILSRADLPAPSPARGRATVAPGSLIAAKLALHLALRKSGLKKGELAARLGVSPTAVTRLLDPGHASALGQLDAAFAALGARMVVSLQSGR